MHDDIFQVVKRYLIEIMELEDDELEIMMESRFQDDLELESIEMIALGEALREYYVDPIRPHQVDFARWLTQLSLEQLMELKVSDLVEWIAQELSDS